MLTLSHRHNNKFLELVALKQADELQKNETFFFAPDAATASIESGKDPQNVWQSTACFSIFKQKLDKGSYQD